MVWYNQGMFTYKTKVRLHHTDAAGILFFANQFTIIHDAYEDLLEKFGWSFRQMLGGKKFFLPIVHAASDYKTPLSVGDPIVVQISVGHIGETSFSFLYAIKRGSTLVGSAKTVHVTVNAKTRRKIKLPASLRAALKRHASKAR